MTKNLTTGGLIRERRIAQALSLGQLASRLGVPPASVRAWERGDESLPEKLAPSVADALGLQAADLLPAPPAPQAKPAKEAKPEKVEAAPSAAAVPAAQDAASTPRATTPKKPKAATAKTPVAAEGAEETKLDKAIDADSRAEPTVEPATETELVAEAVAVSTDTVDKQERTVEPEPADAVDALADDEPVAAMALATDPETAGTIGSDENEAGEEPAEAETPLTDLPTEMVEVIPVAFTDEATQAVPHVPTRPSVDDLASTAAVDALLSGSATATSSTQIVGAPVTVVAEKLPYWKDPNQRWRYWARAIATVAIMGVFLVVLGWAFGELSDALGGFLDQFSDASDADPLNR